MAVTTLLICFLVVQLTLGFAPDENPDLFEGDIELPPPSGFRSALADRARLWDNGVVPYEYSDKSFFDEDQRANITAAMEEFHKYTCIRFVPRTTEEYYIRIQNGNGCSSQVGKVVSSIVKFVQRLVLGFGCFNKGLIMHELMHSIGFIHEQSRWDRDQYVRIVPTAIRQGLLDQFRIHKIADQNQNIGPYDYGSLMHYRRNTFSEDGSDTIIPLEEGAEIGQRDHFSELDIYKINQLYKCPGHLSATLSPDAYIPPIDRTSKSRYPADIKTNFGCTFDQSWACDFHDEMSNDLDWKIKKGPASRDGSTGPNADAFGYDCCYMYIHTVAHDPGESARLVGPYLKARTPSCLIFWYHMHGESIGTLRVYIRDYRGEKGDVVFEKSGKQGDQWLQARVPVEYYTPFQLVFEATVGNSRYSSYEGDIAIDSVRYRDVESMGYAGC